MEPYAFLFDADRLGQLAPGGYHEPALRAFAEAVLKKDVLGKEQFLLLHGDLMVHALAMRTVSVGSRNTVHGGHPARTEAINRDLWMTVVWDFCDSLNDEWHSLDLVQLPYMLGRTNVFALSASALTRAVADHADLHLRGVDGYLGAFLVDPGNPVHRRVTIGSLIAEPIYVNRSLLFDPWRSEAPEDPPPLTGREAWYEGLPFAEVRYLTPDEELTELPSWPSSELSSRGARSAKVLQSRTKPTHLDRLAQKVWDDEAKRSSAEFVIDTRVMPRASDAVVEKKKLTDYVLSHDSTSGRSKAQLFESALGITAADWRYLAAQLKEGLHSAEVVSKVRVTEYGIHYNVVSPVKGRNGKVKPVLSAWEVRNGQSPRFITAYLEEAGFELASLPEPAPHRVAIASEGESRWAELWALATDAANAAVEATPPTPMLVSGPWGENEGSEWVEQGSFGFADVAVKDARRGFARWLVKNGKASTVRGRGAVLLAPPSHYDPSEAWAQAFSDVLQRNGVACEWRSWLD